MSSCYRYALAVCLALTSLSQATVTMGAQLPDPRAATVRITSPHGHVTATVIHQSAEFGTVALSCRHSLEHGGWSWDLPQGTRAGRWHVIGKEEDLAMLWDPRPVVTTPARLADQDVDDGETGYSVGYDQELSPQVFSATGGQVKRAWNSPVRKLTTLAQTSDGLQYSSETVTDRHGGPGRSGGGLFNVRGELVGVCSYRGPLGCTFVALDRIVSFLNRCHAKGFARWWQPREALPSPRVLGEWHATQGDQDRTAGRMPAALAHYQAALAAQPSCIRALYGRGVVSRRAGQLDQARADFDKVLTVAANHAPARTSRANVLVSQGQTELALADYTAAVQIAPRYAPAWFNRGLCYERAGQFAAAKADLERAALLAPTASAPALQLARLLSGCADDQVRNPQQAVRWAQRACNASANAHRPALEVLVTAAVAAGDQAESARGRKLLAALAMDSGSSDATRLAIAD